MIAAVETQPLVVRTLLQRRVIDRRTCDQLLHASLLAGLPPVDLLVESDVLSDADLAKAYAEHFGLRYLDLTRRRPSVAWVLALPENVARCRRCLVFGEVSGQLVVAVADPADGSVRAVLQRQFDRPIQYVVSPRRQIEQMHDEIYGTARQKGARVADVSAVPAASASVSVVGLNIIEQLDSIIDEAVDRRASDIHVEPEQDRLRVRMRIDGRMIEARAMPLEALPAFVSRIKVMANLDITERRKPQDGRFTQRSFDQQIDVRVAVIPTVLGERVTMRLLSMDRAQVDLASLGMEPEIRQAFERIIRRPHGIILVTGPTGSGKSTTMYAALQQINSIDRHIITIEDPVEYQIVGVNQVQVDHEHGVTFPAALRSIVRHDPDVIMVGEIRDQETAHLALEASLTGHLVFATLHTNTAVGAMTRLLDMGCEPYLVSSAVIGVLAQRLARRICPECKKTYVAGPAERKLLEVPASRGAVEIAKASGCAHCNRTGYFDRVGLFEFVPFDTAMSEMVMEKASTEVLYAQAVRSGAVTLRMDAVRKVLQQLTTLEEALRITVTEY